MEQVWKIIQFILGNKDMIISNVVAVLTALIAICMVIPGAQPEGILQTIVDFIKKYSKK